MLLLGQLGTGHGLGHRVLLVDPVRMKHDTMEKRNADFAC